MVAGSNLSWQGIKKKAVYTEGAGPVMGFRGFARVWANPFLECRDNQRTRSCFLL